MSPPYAFSPPGIHNIARNTTASNGFKNFQTTRRAKTGRNQHPSLGTRLRHSHRSTLNGPQLCRYAVRIASKVVVRHRVTKPSVSWFQSSLQEPGQLNIVSINPIRAWLPLRIKSEFLTNVSITQQACSYVLTARYVCRVTPDVGSIYRSLSGPLVRIII
jgi:hypothetical protein